MREPRIDKDTSKYIGLTEYRIMAESPEAVRCIICAILAYDPDVVKWRFDNPRPIGGGLYESCGKVWQGVFE